MKGKCDATKNFICQIDKNSKTFKPLSTKDTFNSSGCPDGFYGNDEACYKFYSQERTFNEAEKICGQQNNTHLASAGSYFENTILQLIAKENNATVIWLG